MPNLLSLPYHNHSPLPWYTVTPQFTYPLHLNHLALAFPLLRQPHGRHPVPERSADTLVSKRLRSWLSLDYPLLTTAPSYLTRHQKGRPLTTPRLTDHLWPLPLALFTHRPYCNTTNANLTRLVKLQKWAARMILKADFMTPSEQLFKELNWLPFPKRAQYHICLMVYKCITGQAPEDIFSMLMYVSEHCERQTRSTALDLLHIPRSHSAYFDRAFSVQGPKLWNNLQADIRNSTWISRFKGELKRYLLYNN